MKKILLLLLLFSICAIARAQFQVSGTVAASADRQGFPGVSVIVKGTTVGTTTDMNGRYSLDIPSGTETLVFSFIGFITAEVEVNNRAVIDVLMTEDITELEEIVVIGYGTQKKRLVTGATVKVDGEKLQELSQNNALQGLQGKMAGVNITSTSGQPGAGFDVVIRGVGTNGNAGPMYIVDGMPVGEIDYLNPNDIESIDVLKGAAAAAIYGFRGANGVVQITTKKGTPGKTQLTFDSYYGTQRIGNKLELLNAREYATIMNEQAINSGKLPYFTNAEIAALGKGTDWLDQIMVDNAITQNYSVGLQGGNDISVFSGSISYTGQEGIVGGGNYSNSDRYVFRINSEHTFLNNLVTIGENLTYSYFKKIGIDDDGQYSNHFRGAFNTNPLIPVYDAEGGFYDNSGGEFIDGGTQASPYAQLIYFNQRDNATQRMVGNMFLEVEPIEGLSLRSTIGIENYSDNNRNFTPVYKLSIYSFRDTSTVTQSASHTLTWNWENTARYRKGFGAHNVELLVGTTAIKSQGSSLSATNANLAFTNFKFAYLGNTTYANGPRMSVDGNASEPNAVNSYFGRILYDFDEKYLLNFSFRADGSSKFAKSQRWGYFPSVSAGWVISKENFFANTLLPVDFLKLRASWGQLGNNFVDPFRYLSPIAISNTNYTFGNSEGALTPGAYPNRISNPNLKWETAEQVGLGLDAEFMNGRLITTIDLYKKTTKDWIIQPPVLATVGAEAPWINGGNVVNQGVELQLGWNETRRDFQYSIALSGAFNSNEVKQIPTEGGIIHGETNELWNNAPEFYRVQEGKPVGFFWGYETLGVFQNETEVNNYVNGEGELLQPDALPGDLILKDHNGDGRISLEDKTMIGDPNPNLVYGFTVSCSYKGFDLIINANGVAGNQLVQSYRSVTDQYSNYSKEILNRWHGEGTSNRLPRLTENGKNYATFSDIYIKDGGFLRINNITVGYDLANLIPSEKIRQVRVYLTAQNLFTLTRYSGMDPEIGYGQTFARGVDIGYYPRPQVFLGGLNVKF